MSQSLLRLPVLTTCLFAAAVGVGCLTLSRPSDTVTITLDGETRDQAVTVLRAGLAQQDPEKFWVSIHAAEGLTLGGYGAEVIDFLEPKLATDHDAQHRCGIARELVRAGDEARVSVLAEVLRSPDSYGHTHAAESLYKVYQVGDPKAMRRHFLEGKELKLRLMAAAALGRQGDLDAIAYLRRNLEGDDDQGVKISAWVLGRIGNANDIEPMRRQLDRVSDPVVRAYLEHAMAALGDPDGKIALSRNLDSEDAAIRTYAATWAGDARAGFTQSKLEKMLDDPHEDARVRAAQTLLQLSR